MAEAPTSPGGESGGEQSPRSGNVREQDRFLPIANISRIMKKGLPPNGKIAKDAKETVQECVSEFISFITSEASDKCQREKRKTINGDDLLWAMATLGFEDYIDPLKLYLQKYREMEGDSKGSAKKDAVVPQSGSSAQMYAPIIGCIEGWDEVAASKKSLKVLLSNCSTPLVREHVALTKLKEPISTSLYFEKVVACFSKAYTTQKPHDAWCRELLMCRNLLGLCVKSGLDFNVDVDNALVNLYGKWSEVFYCEVVFDEMDVKQLATWCSMLASYLWDLCMHLNELHMRLLMLVFNSSDSDNNLLKNACTTRLFCSRDAPHASSVTTTTLHGFSARN